MSNAQLYILMGLILVVAGVQYWWIQYVIKREFSANWDKKMAESVDLLTSDDIIAQTLAAMPDEQMNDLASKVQELRSRNE